jgi:nucleotide-binding universal stress UspA family protein
MSHGRGGTVASRSIDRTDNTEGAQMFENVIVGVDGRQGGRDAVALASLLLARDGKLTMTHVHSGTLRPSTAIIPGLGADEETSVEQLLEHERALAGVDAELASVVAYRPGRGLHEQAERQDADLIVVGSSSRAFLGRAFMGDDARTALNGAPCAVATASHGLASKTPVLATIGVGYDGSPESKTALETARGIAAEAHARLRALSVATLPALAYGSLAAGIGDVMGALLTDAAQRVQALEGVDGRAVAGIAEEELALFSADLDLLVVGSRGYGPVRRLVLGSTSAALQRHARCSLLVLSRNASRSTHEEPGAATG